MYTNCKYTLVIYKVKDVRGENMKTRDIILAASIGFVSGYILGKQMESKREVTAEEALQIAKDSFKKTGPISGSWIYMKPEKIKQHGLLYTAYRGGITRNIDGEDVQYEFYSDVKTGTIIMVKEAS